MKFQTIPRPVTAIQWNGTNQQEVTDFISGKTCEHPLHPGNCFKPGVEFEGDVCIFRAIKIGTRKLKPGDWLVSEQADKFWYCHDSHFADDYQIVPEAANPSATLPEPQSPADHWAIIDKIHSVTGQSREVIIKSLAVIEQAYKVRLTPLEAPAETRTKPSELDVIADIFNRCPVTGEAQWLTQVVGAEFDIRNTGVVIETRGDTTAWRHIITTEEMDAPES